MDYNLKVIITRSGEDGKDRHVALSCHTGKGLLSIKLTGTTVSENMARQFEVLTMVLPTLRTLDHQAFRNWREAGSNPISKVGASRRWQIKQDQLLDLTLHVGGTIEWKGEGFSASFEEDPQTDQGAAAEPPQA